MKSRKLLRKVIQTKANIQFADLRQLVEAFGFRLERISGSHHIYKHPHIPELINMQEVKGKAKPYQIRQFLSLVEKYNLQLPEKRL